VFDSADTAAENGKPPIRIKAANASTDILVRKGSVGIAADDASETSTVGDVAMSYISSVDSDANVIIGPGVTITNVLKSGGKCVLKAAATLARQYAGELRTEGTGAIATLDVYDGTVYANATGTIALLTGRGGMVDMRQSRSARTVTTFQAWAGFNFAYDKDIVTITNAIAPQEPVEIAFSNA
jgi:hypothetical protein